MNEIVADAMKGFYQLPDIIAFAMPPQSLGADSSTPISIMLQSSQSYEDILNTGNQLVAEMQKNPGMNQVRLDLRLNKPELQIDIDRQKAANFGVDARDIATTLETLLGSRTVTRFKQGNKQFDVLVQLEQGQRLSPQDIQDIYLRSEQGELVALNNFFLQVRFINA